MQVVLATRNAGKRHEFADMFRGTGLFLATLDDFPEATEPKETDESFEANALLKARAAAEASGLWALGDDSGLCVDALGGRPGVLSARYAPGPDQERWKKLLGELEGLPPERRTARFVCALALASPGGQTHLESGTCEGRIALAPRGVHGFGFDPVFEVAGDPAGRTMAELSTAEKREVSHRGRAFLALEPHLLRLVLG